MNNIKVSIICNTYNHGKYIKDALDGFIMQKTDFEYEILIHDDASTDNTAKIIREYEKKYPNLVKPVYQNENQYSQGINIINVFQAPRVNGKYVALCEGDDYWTDPLKLQKQYDAMEKNVEVDICAHSARKIRESNNKLISIISPANSIKILPLEDIIAGGGGYVATNSLFYRRRLLEERPKFIQYCQLDYALQIQGGLRGGMLFLPDCMSIYRALVPGSWTSSMSKKGYNSGQVDKIKKMLDMVNEETNGEYRKIIDRAKIGVEFSSLELAGCYKELRKGNMRILYNEQTILWKIKSYIKQYFPFLLDLYRK